MTSYTSVCQAEEEDTYSDRWQRYYKSNRVQISWNMAWRITYI